MSTSGDVLAAMVERLRAAGVEQPRLDARLLLAHALEVDAGWVFTHPEQVLSAAQIARVEQAAIRRVAREPVSRITGHREFWGLDFALSAATLDPRPDTETVVEAVLAQRADRAAPLHILDLGTGTGCILLALLSEFPKAHGLGIDVSAEAVLTASGNADHLGLTSRCDIRVGNWCDGLTTERFDIIVANPPYIEDDLVARLEPEVAQFDPMRALAGGVDGLDAYRVLAPQIASFLAPGGLAAFEIGQGQAARIVGILGQADLAVIDVRRDLAGTERCVVVSPKHR